jgi:hypothetical protein
MPRIACGLLRRVLVYALAYALVLQGLFISRDSAWAAVGTAGDAGFSEFTLCSHGGTGPTLPGTPTHGPAGDNNCIFCIVAAVYVDSATPPSTQVIGRVIAGTVTPFAAPVLFALLINQSAWPRGPPAAA